MIVSLTVSFPGAGWKKDVVNQCLESVELCSINRPLLVYDILKFFKEGAGEAA